MKTIKTKDCVTIPKTEYRHLLLCKGKLIQLLEIQKKSYQTNIVNSAMDNVVSQPVSDVIEQAMQLISTDDIKFKK